MKIAKSAKVEFRRFRGGRGTGTYIGQAQEQNGTWITLNQGDKKSPHLIKVRPAQILSINGKSTTA